MSHDVMPRAGAKMVAVTRTVARTALPKLSSAPTAGASSAESGLTRHGQTAAVSTALVLLLGMTLSNFAPEAELRLLALPLLLGLLCGPVARRVRGVEVNRLAVPLSALVSLCVLVLWLPSSEAITPPNYWPLWFVALLLGAVLISAPGDPRSAERSGLPIVALAALLALLWPFTMQFGLAYHFLGSLSLRLALVFLGLSLAAGALLRDPAARRIIEPAGMVAALIALLVTLLVPSARDIYPQWPYSYPALILAAGLLASPAWRYAGRPMREVALAERVVELSRTRRGVLDLQTTELQRIERDLHDGAQVRLVALSLKLGRAEHRYRDDPETAALLREAREDAAEAIRELRELARGIAPPVLTDRGLEAAVQSLADRSGSEVAVTSGLSGRQPTPVETAAYFVVAESLTNAGKHAPGARVEISLHERAGYLLVEIVDFGPGGANPAGAGLTGLRQRIEAVDGTLHVISPEGVGTQIEAELPCGR